MKYELFITPMKPYSSTLRFYDDKDIQVLAYGMKFSMWKEIRKEKIKKKTSPPLMKLAKEKKITRVMIS